MEFSSRQKSQKKPDVRKLLDDNFVPICVTLTAILLLFDFSMIAAMLSITPLHETEPDVIEEPVSTSVAYQPERTAFKLQRNEFKASIFTSTDSTETTTNLSKPYKTLQEDCKVTTSQDLVETSQIETEAEPADPVTEPEIIELVEEPVQTEGSDCECETVTCYVTAYCGCSECSDEFGPYTRFGTPCQPNHTVAVDPDFIPYWSQLEINGITYTAEDCGGAVNGWEIDIYFAEHWQTELFKTGFYEVKIL